jgi:membrane-associated phospholipid phosphatase
VYGGEHFVADIVVGWLYAAIAFTAVTVAWPAWRRARVRRDDDAALAGQAEPAGAGAARI